MKKTLLFSAAFLASMASMAQTPGDYYIQHAATGQFLNGANSWGTKASLTHGGQLMTLAAGSAEGTFTLDTHISNGGNSHFLGTNGFVDAAAADLTFEEAENGAYTISCNGQYLALEVVDGQNQANFVAEAGENALWKLVSKADILAMMADVEKENPLDVTSLIADYNFGRNNQYFNAWQGGPTKNGNNDNMCAEKWNCTFDVFQTLTGLPAGIYKVKIQGFYRPGSPDALTEESAEVLNATFYANEQEAPLASIMSELGNITEGNDYNVGKLPNSMPQASTAFSAGLYDTNELTVNVTDGTLKIGVKKDAELGNDWTIFDNVRLEYYGASLDELIESMGTVIADAKALDLTVAHNKALDKDLEDAIAAAEAITADNTKTEIMAAQAAIGTAVAAINASAADYAAALQIIEAPKADMSEAAVEAYEADELIVALLAAYNDGTLDPATVTTAAVNEAAKKAIIATIVVEPGADLTAYITNADFANKGEGWDGVGLKATAFEFQGATYTNEDVTIVGFMERWVPGTGPLSASTMSQTLTLPAGQYTLTADVITCNQSTGEEVSGVTVFAGENTVACSTGNGKPETVSVNFSVEEGEEVVIGIAVAEDNNANWVGVDNFKLTYSDLPVAISATQAVATKQEGIYNLAGQRLEKMAKGINIVGGKKVIK